MSKYGIPTDEQLAKINKLSRRSLEKEEVFVFPNKLAGDMIIPNRHVQLTKELLDVFSTDANKGVSLLLDHSWAPDGFFGLGGRPKMAMPYGRTFDSRFESATEEGETISLIADHYMARGIELDGIKTDDLISSIEAGTLFDSSIGFSYENDICSVCGESYRGSKCDHVVGRTYEIEGEDEIVRNKLCYIKAKPPGFLMENSLVFDGAYPSAGVLSSVGEILENETGKYQIIGETKEIDPNKALISTYSEKSGLITMVKKSDHKKIFNGIDLADESPKIMGGNGKVVNLKGGEKNMDEKILKVLEKLEIEYVEGETTFEELFNQLGEKWDSVIEIVKEEVKSEQLQVIEDSTGELLVAESVIDNNEYLAIPVEEISEKLGAELSADDVLKLAKEGQDYHKLVIEETIAMGVRAQGNDFTAETWKETFASMSTKAIKDIAKTFEAQAKNIPVGRHTNPDNSKKFASIPDGAFKVGK